MTAEHPRAGSGALDPRPEVAYGWWPSSRSAASVAAGKISRSGLMAEGAFAYWVESRPDQGGAQVVVRARPGAPAADISPAGTSVRSRVHEYGGGAFVVSGEALFTVDQSDQAWHRTALDGSGPPTALIPPNADTTPGTGPPRYADGRVTATGRWLISVEERTKAGRTEHRLVAVATGGSPTVVPLVAGRDFVSAPRPSPDGAFLAWVAWDHPAMPWDSSEVWVAPIEESGAAIGLGPARRVAGGDGVSVGQPQWLSDGSLLFADDRTGWWLPYRIAGSEVADGGTAGAPLVDLEAEFHAPDWGLGQSTMAELSDGSLACRLRRNGRDEVVRLVGPDPSAGGTGTGTGTGWELLPLDQPCVDISGVAALTGSRGEGAPDLQADTLLVLGSTPAVAHAVFAVPLDASEPPVSLSAIETGTGTADTDTADTAAAVSVGRPFTAATPSGSVPGLFFAPASPDAVGAAGTRPPLVVFCHGGPTGASPVGFDPVIQFFTTRGLAVAAVDYRGSSGYGREFRRALNGRWGEADIDDCAAFAVALAAAGLVDGDRMAIRGSSAGGMTALGALIRSDEFVGACSWYGVTDLEALATDTHAFESRYLDGLIGPYPEAVDRYRARSPIHHAAAVKGAVLLLQGADDPVVPPDQSERFAAMLTEHGIPCRMIVFPGESHGFRAAEVIEACLAAELDCYRSLFGGPVEGPDSE